MVLNTTLALRREFRDWKARRREGPEKTIAHRQSIKRCITTNMRWRGRDKAPRIIIRDLARIDQYPDADDAIIGISSWFPADVRDLYHRGIEVSLRIQEMTITRGKARHTRARTPADRRILIAGRIPFDAIVAIDWAGDELNPQPHFFCWFDQADGPYEAMRLYEQGYGGSWIALEDVKYVPSRRALWSAWRTRRALRAAQRDYERDAHFDRSD
jgi:hypothetical protein